MYYLYFPLWQVFFNELGAEVVTSGRTTRVLLDHGVREALADACVPVKVFFGHVMALKDKVDYLFIPRVVCLNRRTVYCPKFLGLPDMIRHSLPGLPPIIDERMDVRAGRAALFRAYRRIGSSLGVGPLLVVRALARARRADARYHSLLLDGWRPPEAMTAVPAMPKEGRKPDLTFGVLGYPYAVYDDFLNAGLLEKLKRLKVRALTAENLAPGRLAAQTYDYSKRLFWTFSDQVLRATHLLFEEGKVDGIIHVSVFGCGPDSITDKMMELKAKLHRAVPFMTLIIDEHTGEAGLTTRLEAFADMVRRRKETVPCSR
jgi:predicted nucleotide-binding protein (sugar kinase/HSP70/actin superfamily)